jgi:hypothetical protein
MLTMVGRGQLPAGYVRRLESPAASHTVFHRRCIKRYLARHLYRTLTRQPDLAPQTT